MLPEFPAPPVVAPSFRAPFYPIVYVRGFAPTSDAREGTFNDLYYGYSDTSVERRDKTPVDADALGDRIALDLFEGQLIRFIKEYAYVDASHGGLKLATTGQTAPFQRPRQDPTRSIWISRFYDVDYLTNKVRTIDKHAAELWELINVTIPQELANYGVDKTDYKVILVAHSMGGLVCRALLQKLLPDQGIDPKSIVHRLVTIASPHGGIEFGAVPDAFENFVVNTFNPGDSRIFKEDFMRHYLNLSDPKDENDTRNPPNEYKYPLNSLGRLKEPGAAFSFPQERCFCLIGSDYHSYSVVQKITGGFSDGLVKQNNAFIEGAYTANVHRAHSGYRGIVNSFESYENIHRFLFGDTKVKIALDDIKVAVPPEIGDDGFYNFEFRVCVRNGGGVYLHQRREDPCENAKRFGAKALPTEIDLHTLFLSSHRRADEADPYLNFLLTFRVVEHRVGKFLLWDHDYPGRTIYGESLEVRVNADAVAAFYAEPAGTVPPTDLLQYQWLSDPTTNDLPDGGWQNADLVGGGFVLALRDASSLSGKLLLTPSSWPDNDLTHDLP